MKQPVLANPDITPSVLATPQQQLLGEEASDEALFRLGRACVAHCVTAAQKFMGDTTDTSQEKLVDFVLRYGANSGSELYVEGSGWSSVGLADLMHIKGYSVVLQNMRFGPEDFSIQNAVKSGRVKSSEEKSKLVIFTDYGGKDQAKWVDAFKHTLAMNGLVISSIQIPLLSGDGYGLHSVVLTDVDESTGEIEYFDPDMYNLQRYGVNSLQIQRMNQGQLLYRRPISEHLAFMTGEIMHVFPPRS